MNPITLDEILAPTRIAAAWGKVRSNRGAAGEDSVTINELDGHFDHYWPGVERSIRSGQYRPAPLRPVSIPKPSGGVRKLAIPSVMDRVIQQAIAAVMSERWDPVFPDCSYAYRPGLGAVQALDSALNAAHAYRNPVALRFDIKDFFDTVPYQLCDGALTATPCSPDLTTLVMRAVAAPLASVFGPSPRSCGIPQGSPLSPVMANIVLLPFDHEMQMLPGHYLRYADDMMVICPDESAAAAMLGCAREELDVLGLHLNERKTSMLPLHQASFLGCGFQAAGGSWVRKLPDSTIVACREHLSSLADSGRPSADLQQFLGQWAAYFLPYQEDRLRHTQFLDEMRTRFRLAPSPEPFQGKPRGKTPSGTRPPNGFHYDGSPATNRGKWDQAAWAGRFLLRRIHFGLTFKRKGFVPVPSGLRIHVMGHHFNFRF